MKNKRVLLIDALNLFIRNYIVDPSLSTNGHPIGGAKGFIKSLQAVCRIINPDLILVAWDGGSQKRKSMDKNYKAGRKPVRLNRDIHNMTAGEQEDNKNWQQERIIEYLNEMPILQSYVENVEADDIIALVSQSQALSEHHKIILSSDKDFIQLCDDTTILYRPIQKEILNKKRILEQFQIHPTNFALARAIAGDKSDNLPGVGGAGLATISKRFPFLSEEKAYTIQELVDYAENADSKLKVFKNIIENKDLIEKNYKMMQLYAPCISAQSAQHIRRMIGNPELTFNKTGVRAMMIEDGFGAYDWNDLFTLLNRITVENKGR
jgi:DNA polymerase-1|tara:strand:+ start:385 stop:1350 length:966 start_codon:yes stop_codon:yes gene_type:complete